MRPAAGRLVVTALLFVGWLAYLGYLVWTRPQTADGRPLVLSRPQLLISDLDVIARIDDPTKGVKVVRVLYPAKGAKVQPGEEIFVDNIRLCRALPYEGLPPPSADYTGPGEYLLPLQRKGDDKYEVAPTPRSPGYPPTSPKEAPTREPGLPRIYPATEQALAQYREVPKP